MASGGRRLRIPVENVDGVWECALGGAVPARPGAVAELLIDRGSIADPKFLQAMEGEGRHQVLAEGAKLLVTLTCKAGHGPDDALWAHAVPLAGSGYRVATEMLDSWSPAGAVLVPITLTRPVAGAAERPPRAPPGLWMLTQGLKTTGIVSGPIALPQGVLEGPARSLNHALTVLSEVYEAWRISHTGNVYSRVLYCGSDGRWYPLDVLRGVALQNQGQAIAGQLWRDFMQRMSRERAARGG